MAAPTAKQQNALRTKRHHYIRTTVSSFFGFIALALIIVSILVVWLDRTLTDSSQYVKTVAPLVTKPDVQNFVVTKASNALLDNDDAPIQDIATKLLPADQVAGKTNPQGLEPGPEPEHKSYSSFTAFSDPDGNGWVVQEIRERLPGRV